MENIKFYNETAFLSSQLLAKRYSTSFSAAMSLLSGPTKTALYNIYAYVRVADEMVDTLRPKNAKKQLEDFIVETDQAIKSGVSMNLTIHSFAITVNKYNIPTDYIQAFFRSMKMDLTKKRYTKKDYDDYIYGSAEVIGLMSLCVFSEGKKSLIKKTNHGAKKLGSAFQKVNFLRDISSDKLQLGRIYFPGINFKSFNDDAKKLIVEDIRIELKEAKQAVGLLPPSSKYGVKLAMYYYSSLLRKIDRTPASEIKIKRVRINDFYKLIIFISVYLRKLLNIA